MQWIYLLTLALVLISLSWSLRRAAEGLYSVLAATSGLVSLIWGLIHVPGGVLVAIAISLLLVFELSVRRSDRPSGMDPQG